MRQLLRSFSAAIKGIRVGITGQRNLKIQMGISLLVIVLGISVDLSAGDWGLVATAIGLVITAELMNTAVESLVDRVEPRQNPIAGKVKDVVAGAVLIAALTAVVIGVVVFYKYLP